MDKDTQDKKRVVLLDAHAIIHRAYHALPEFMNSKGEPTGAIYGLSTMLFKIISELKPDYIFACYDLPKKTFRHVAYKEYKAGRAKADDMLVAQFKNSRELFRAFSVPIYECEGFEADDLLGTISYQLKSLPNIEIIIASGDMDTLQLVDKDIVKVYTLKKGINDTILYDEKKVIERFGFEPKYLPDYKGLRGDPSDNIIGIKGVGEKTAMTLISHFKTIENMYEDLKNDKSDSTKISSEAVKDKLKKIGITKRIEELILNGEEEANFSKTLATIRNDAPIDFSFPKEKWRETVKENEVLEFFKEMEFKSLHSRFLNIVKGENKEGVSGKEDKKENITIKKEDLNKMEKAKIAFWLLDSEKTNPNEEDVIYYKNSKNIDESLGILEKEIKEEGLGYVYREIEMPIIDVIKKMEKNGVLVDRNYLKELSKDYHKELSKLEKEIWNLAGTEFNINSPKQLGEILFDKIGLSVKGLKKSKGGARSTRESELEKLKDLHPAISKILEYRELQKLLSTYIDTMPDSIKEDGRLHASFIQTGTTTGRFSSSNPNLQNIPIKTEKGKKIRNAFVARDGHLLVSFDYSQIELRVAALMSQDPYFIKAFREGKDIHQAVAMKVFNVDENEVTPEMRRRAKIINFGILYGMGVNALRENLGGDRKEAQIFYDNYFAQFPTIAEYLESIKEKAKKDGFTKTLFGRKRYFRGIKSHIPFIRAMNERMAVNAPIQGTATADIIKIGMKKAEDILKSKNLDESASLILQIHDELMYEIKEDKINEVIDAVKKEMENVIPESFISGLEEVPLLVSVNFGKSWGDLK